MSSAQPPNPPSSNNNDKKPEGNAPAATPAAGDNAPMDTTPDIPPQENWDDIPEEILSLSTDEILTRIRLIDNDIKVKTPVCVFSTYIYYVQVMRSETLRLQHEQSVMKEKIRDNGEKIKQNKVLPYLVGNIVEVRSNLLVQWQRAHGNLADPRYGP